jgi:hypothetical protein
MGALLAALASPKAWAEPVRCASGPAVIYQNVPCPAGYVASALSGSFSVVAAEPRKNDVGEGVRAISAKARARVRVKTPRNPANVREFRSLYPCPSTLEEAGPCPGYVVDHKTPLACGGLDDFRNMQWQTTAEAKAKDKWELQCRN